MQCHKLHFMNGVHPCIMVKESLFWHRSIALVFSIFLNKFILSAGICAVTTFVGRYVASILIYPLVIPMSISIGFFDLNILVFSNRGFDIRFSSRNWQWNWAWGLFSVLVRYKNLKYRRPKPSLMRSQLNFEMLALGILGMDWIYTTLLHIHWYPSPLILLGYSESVK